MERWNKAKRINGCDAESMCLRRKTGRRNLSVWRGEAVCVEEVSETFQTFLLFHIRDPLSWVLCRWKLDKSHLKAQKWWLDPCE